MFRFRHHDVAPVPEVVTDMKVAVVLLLLLYFFLFLSSLLLCIGNLDSYLLHL